MTIFDSFLSQSRDGIKPVSGSLLIAAPFLNDRAFFRSVVFLCEHSNDGTLGFVLNRPSTNTLNMLLPELRLPGVSIFEGGPVQTNTLQILHRMPEFLGGVEVMPGIYWGASYEELADLCHRGLKVDASKIRLFRGYSGWDEGKLDHELQEGAWITTTADSSLIFNEDSDALWALSLSSMGTDYARLANLPLYPSQN